MVKETITTQSTSQKVEAAQAYAAQTAGEKQSYIQPGVAQTAQAMAPTYVDQAQLKELEYRLSTKVAQGSGAKTGLLWFVTLIALGAAGFAGYTAFQNQQKIMAYENAYNSVKQQISDATFKVEQKATLLENAQTKNAALEQTTASLAQNYQTLGQSLNGLIAAQQQQAQSVNDLASKVAAFETRNPFDWQLAESYFLVNNASVKAVFDKDIKAAVWMLTQADELLKPIEEEKVVALREAISKDIAALNNISLVDIRGLGMTLDRAYDNIDNLVLEGYSDPKVRAAAFEKTQETTKDISDWKANLLNSANDFAARFVEVRRRNAEAATEFLTPEQDLYLRENIKTRILLAKSDLSHGDKEAMQANLADAIKLVKAYFDPESTVTQNTLKMLTSIEQSEITIKTPEVLQSATAFSEFARQHLLGRGM